MNVERLIAEGRILFPKKPEGRPREKKFLRDLQSAVTGFSTWLSADSAGYNYLATRQLRDLLDGKYFDFPKPVELLTTLCEQVVAGDDLVLDFFAGSGTTAQAVLELNARDGGNRRFALIQLAEDLPSESDGAAAGYSTISELARARIRRSGLKILDGDGHSAWGRDVGFRVLKVDTTNMSDVLRTPDALGQDELALHTDSVKNDRTAEDLLFQVLLDWGLELTMPIETEAVDGQDVLVVEDDALIACFSESVSPKVVLAIAERQPLRAVFRDSGFATDADRINAEQIFAERSPATDVKTI